jgi:hypothetical protein
LVPLSSVNITIVNATKAFFFCRALQNRVQTTSSAAPSLIAPGLAFMFTALEPAAITAATNVTAMLTAGSTLQAACQQTFSSLFRGLTPPSGVKITIHCPKCMAICSQGHFISVDVFKISKSI